MPWENAGPGQFHFSGALGDWMPDLMAWYAADVPDGASVSEMEYLETVACVYSLMARERWAKAPLGTGRRRVRVLESMPTKDPDGSLSIPVFDVLDYVATHVNTADRRSWETEARTGVRRLLSLP